MARRGSALALVQEQAPQEAREMEREARSFADLDEVAEFADGLPERFLYCREMGHNWRPYSAGAHEDGGFERVLRCTRCRTRRVQVITPRGIVLSNRYEYADGYQANPGMGRIIGEGRGILRLESIKRIVAKGD